jgi:arsenate reductase-like glutaredoxin family protein
MKYLKEYNKTCKWLEKHGFNDKDIVYIKRIYDREGIRFTIKSFNVNELEEMREELYNIYGKEQLEFYEELLSSVSGVDVNKAMSMLM